MHLPRRGGGTGRRARFRSWCPLDVEVRVLSSAPFIRETGDGRRETGDDCGWGGRPSVGDDVWGMGPSETGVIGFRPALPRLWDSSTVYRLPSTGMWCPGGDSNSHILLDTSVCGASRALHSAARKAALATPFVYDASGAQRGESSESWCPGGDSNSHILLDTST